MFTEQEKLEMNAKAKGIARGVVLVACIIAIFNAVTPAHALDNKNDQLWNEFSAQFQKDAQKQSPDGSWLAHKCDKARSYCFRSMEMVNDEGFLVSVVELLNIEDTIVHDRMVCTMLNKERTFRKCRNFDTGIEVLDKYIGGRWVLANPPV